MSQDSQRQAMSVLHSTLHILFTQGRTQSVSASSSSLVQTREGSPQRAFGPVSDDTSVHGDEERTECVGEEVHGQQKDRGDEADHEETHGGEEAHGDGEREGTGGDALLSAEIDNTLTAEALSPSVPPSPPPPTRTSPEQTQSALTAKPTEVAETRPTGKAQSLTPPTSMPSSDWFAELSWLLPLICGWELAGLSAESHIFLPNQMPSTPAETAPAPQRATSTRKRGRGRPRTTARGAVKSEKTTETEEEESAVAGTPRTVFRVELRHSMQPQEERVLLVPTTVSGGADTTLTMSANLTDPELVIYDVTHARAQTVPAAMAALLSSSLQIAERPPPRAVKTEVAAPKRRTKPTQKKPGKSTVASPAVREKLPLSSSDVTVTPAVAAPGKRPRGRAGAPFVVHDILIDDEAMSGTGGDGQKTGTSTSSGRGTAQRPSSDEGPRTRGRPRKRAKKEDAEDASDPSAVVVVKTEDADDETKSKASPSDAKKSSAVPKSRKMPQKNEQVSEEKTILGLSQDRGTSSTPTAAQEGTVPTPASGCPSLQPPFTSLLAMEEALSSSLALSVPHVTTTRKERAVSTHAGQRDTPLSDNVDKGREKADMDNVSLLELFADDVATNRAPAPSPPSPSLLHESVVHDDVPEEALRVADAQRPDLAPPVIPQNTSKLVYRGHRVLADVGCISSLFSTPDHISARVVSATTTPAARRRARSVSPGRGVSGATARQKDPSPTREDPSGQAPSTLTPRGAHVQYLAALDSVRKTYSYALSMRERSHHNRSRRVDPCASPRSRTPRTCLATARSAHAWKKWLAVTRRRMAQQEVNQWMQEGLQVALPSPQLRGDTLAAGVRALCVAERGARAYGGGLMADTTLDPFAAGTDADDDVTKAQMPVRPPDSSDAGTSSLWDSGGICPLAFEDTVDDDQPDRSFSSTGPPTFPRPPPPDFLPISGFALLQAQERITANFHAVPFCVSPPTTIMGKPDGEAQADVHHAARCTLFPRGIPSADALPITNTFRTHSPYCAVPSGVPSLSPAHAAEQGEVVEGGEVMTAASTVAADSPDDATHGGRSAVQYAAVPNPFQDVGYYVHRRFLSHRLREMVDRDGVLAITADGVYPDTEAVKAYKRTQLTALKTKAAQTSDPRAARALQDMSLCEWELSEVHEESSPIASTDAPARTAPSTPSETTTAAAKLPTPTSLPQKPAEDDGSAFTSPSASPTNRGPIDNSEAVGDQVDRLLRRGHTIKRVPMPNVEWNYGPV